MNDISANNINGLRDNTSRLNLDTQNETITQTNGQNGTNENNITNNNNTNQNSQSTAVVPANNINRGYGMGGMNGGMGGMSGGYGMGGMGGGYGMGGMGGGYGMGGMGGGMGGMNQMGGGMQPEDPNRPRGIGDDLSGTMQGMQSLMQVMSAGVGMYSFGGMFVQMAYKILSYVFGTAKSGILALFVNRFTLSVAKGMTVVATKHVESGNSASVGSILIKYGFKC